MSDLAPEPQENPAHGPETPVQPAATPTEPRKKTSWTRRLLILAGALLCALLLLIALGPTLLSTGPGTALVRSVAAGQIDGTLKMSGLSVGWFSGTQLKEAVVEDDKGIRVLELANLTTGLSLLDLLRGNYALGDASLRLGLPTVVVYADGSTNLDKVFRLDQTPPADKSGKGGGADKPAELPNLTGSLKLDGGATVQYVGTTTADGTPPPPVSVTFDGTKLVFGEDKSLQHTLPLALRVNSTPAGTVTAVGTVDLNSLSNDLPTVREKLDVADVDLDAVSTLLTALGFTDVTLAGTLGGTLSADTAANTLTADFTGRDFAATQRGAAGAADTGYATQTLALKADGGFTFVDTPPSTQPATGQPATATKRPVVTLNSSTLATDDLTANLTGTFDLVRDSYADFQSLVKDATVNVQSDFLTVDGTVRNLGQMNLSFNGDVDAFQKRFGTLVDLGGLDPAGRFSGTLKADRQLGMEFGPVIVASLDVKADGVALDAKATDAEPAKSLRLGKIAFSANGYLPAKSQSVEKLTASFNATDAAGQTLASGGLTADGLDLRRSRSGRVSLDGLKLPDYAALQKALAGWVELPEPVAPVGKLEVTAAATYDADAKRVTLAEPLRATLDGRPLATVVADAAATGETTWQVNAMTADVDLPAANALAKALYDAELDSKESPDGRVSLTSGTDQRLTFDTNDIAATLAGRVEVAMENARASGMTATGRFPVLVKGLTFAIPGGAPPLAVNGGTVRLAGATLDAGGEKTILQLPQPPPGRQLAENVSINPVLGELLGKYVNPFLVGAAEASGLLDAKITSDTPLNLTDLTGPSGGRVDITFSLRDLRLVSPKIRELAGPNLAQFERLTSIDIPLPENIDTLEGNIADARVGLNNGLADTDITFNVADPRELFGKNKVDQAKLTLYPLHFGGSVNLTSYAIKIDMGVPQPLVEKWWPDGVSLLKSLKPKNGATLALGGTTFAPTLPALNASSVADLAGKAAKDRAADELDKRLPDQFKGLGDLLRGGKKDK